MALLNQIKTVFLISLLISIVIWAGYYFGGIELAIAFASISIIIQWIMLFYSDKLVLWMYHAREVQSGRLYEMVMKLTREFDLPMPKVYIAEIPIANAFATGISPKKSAVCVTRGLLQLLNEEELRGVLAHELSHIKNRDTLISMVAITISTIISSLAMVIRYALFFRSRDRDSDFLGMILFSILAPIIATLIHLAISRTREYLADETAARKIRNGLALANALRKIESSAKIVPSPEMLNTENIFIVNPFRGSSLLYLFSTHPPTTERIKRLEKIHKELY
ncbi:MAG: M48 family metalloprotease [Candidatus Woesearchaeota archaeon]